MATPLTASARAPSTDDLHYLWKTLDIDVAGFNPSKDIAAYTEAPSSSLAFAPVTVDSGVLESLHPGNYIFGDGGARQSTLTAAPSAARAEQLAQPEGAQSLSDARRRPRRGGRWAPRQAQDTHDAPPHPLAQTPPRPASR